MRYYPNSSFIISNLEYGHRTKDYERYFVVDLLNHNFMWNWVLIYASIFLMVTWVLTLHRQSFGNFHFLLFFWNRSTQKFKILISDFSINIVLVNGSWYSTNLGV